MAYVLGFIAADGYVFSNKNGGKYLGIKITDRDVLCAIRSTMGSNHTIGVRKSKGGVGSACFVLQVGNKEMYADLLRHGITENKTHTLLLPDIPQEYLGSFVRGYFDGDGNVWVGNIHTNRKHSRLHLQVALTCGSKPFLETLKERLEFEGIVGGSIVRVKNKSVYRYQLSKRNAILLHRLMYERMTPGLCIERKFKRFEKFLQIG